MENTKQWYKSKTIWSALVVAVIGTLSMFGVGQLEGEQESVTEFVMQLVTIISGLIALIGRVKAKTEIKSDKSGGNIMPVLICLALLMFCGCGSKVQMTPEYSQTLQQSAINVDVLEQRCLDGDIEACQEGLTMASDTLDLLVDAWLGVDSTEGGE